MPASREPLFLDPRRNVGYGGGTSPLHTTHVITMQHTQSFDSPLGYDHLLDAFQDLDRERASELISQVEEEISQRMRCAMYERYNRRSFELFHRSLPKYSLAEVQVDHIYDTSTAVQMVSRHGLSVMCQPMVDGRFVDFYDIEHFKNFKNEAIDVVEREVFLCKEDRGNRVEVFDHIPEGGLFRPLSFSRAAAYIRGWRQRRRRDVFFDRPDFLQEVVIDQKNHRILRRAFRLAEKHPLGLKWVAGKADIVAVVTDINPSISPIPGQLVDGHFADPYYPVCIGDSFEEAVTKIVTYLNQQADTDWRVVHSCQAKDLPRDEKNYVLEPAEMVLRSSSATPPNA